MIVENEQAVEAIAKIVEFAMKGAVAVEENFDRAKAHNRTKMIESGLDADQMADAEEFFESQREQARATTTRIIVKQAFAFWAKQNGADRITFLAATEESE